jgi:hypothetical protein
MSTTPVTVQIVKTGGTFYLRIPPSYCRANKLEAGDFIIYDPTKFKILKPEDFALLGRETQAEVAGE